MVTKSQLWATVLLLSTFVAGAVVGGGATAAWGDRNRPARADRDPGNRERGFVATLTRELSLKPDQGDSVRAIVRRYDPAFRSVMETTRPRFDSLRAQVHADIMKVLDQQQKDGFTKWAARMDSETVRRRARDADRNKKENDRAH